MREEEYIQKTLKLARKGLGKVSPNPMVGAIIVRNGRIISTGYHSKFGGAHAEINAMKRAKENIKGSILYVNLEPCCVYGKTPPCTEAILKSGIKKVIIGDIDPNPEVAGKGIQFLENNGIKVKHGILQKECRKLNNIFYKYMETGLPFVAMKIAQTLDGKISEKAGKETSITSISSKRIVHKLRSYYDAVLIGKNTAIIDNPSLTVRLYKGKSPKRILLDESLLINPGLKILNKPLAEDTIIVTTKQCDTRMKKKLEGRNINIITAQTNKSGLVDLKDTLRKIGKLGISSVFVEGGADIFSSFFANGLVDKLYVFIAPKIFMQGIDNFGKINGLHRFNKQFRFDTVKKIDDDIIIEASI